MLTIGCHLSSSKGFLHMGRQAVSIGANTFQFFTRNPRGGSVKQLDEADISAYNTFAHEKGMGTIVAHAPYTLNPCSADGRTREFAFAVMQEDLRRMEYIPGTLYNFHPGSHVGQGTEAGTALICELLNATLSVWQSTTVLLETMAGKGTEVGRSFAELRKIIDGVKLEQKVGVCMDICHVSDAGYDVVENLDGVLDEFDRVIGLGRLRAIHLNDSKNPRGSHKDRHEKLGEGSIGTEAFARIINHEKLRGLPFILETPNELEGYAGEIALLKSLYQGK